MEEEKKLVLPENLNPIRKQEDDIVYQLMREMVDAKGEVPEHFECLVCFQLLY
jgi:hypothetical protein